MSLKEYEDFVFSAVHAHEDDPIAYWNSTAAGQQKAIDFLAGKSQVVTLRGPNVDLTPFDQGPQIHEFNRHVQHARW